MLAEETSNLSDDELFDEIRLQVNLSRNSDQGHDRERTRAIGEEFRRRGWNLRTPQLPTWQEEVQIYLDKTKR